MSLRKNKGTDSLAGGQNLDPQLVVRVLMGQPRRKLLIALFSRGPQTAAELMHVGKGGIIGDEKSYIDMTGKNLALMVEAGMVDVDTDQQDGRRTVYSLSPKVKVTREGDLVVFDFGSRMARLDADGN